MLTGCRGGIGKWRRPFWRGRGWLRDNWFGTVMPITGVWGWGDRMEAHMDHAWLMMRSHAQRKTRVHSGELGVVEVGGGGDNGGDDDARSRTTAGTRGSKGKGVGRPRKAQRTPPPLPFPLSPLSPPLPKWQIGCSSSSPSPSGSSGL